MKLMIRLNFALINPSLQTKYFHLKTIGLLFGCFQTMLKVVKVNNTFLSKFEKSRKLDWKCFQSHRLCNEWEKPIVGTIHRLYHKELGGWVDLENGQYVQYWIYADIVSGKVRNYADVIYGSSLRWLAMWLPDDCLTLAIIQNCKKRQQQFPADEARYHLKICSVRCIKFDKNFAK